MMEHQKLKKLIHKTIKQAQDLLAINLSSEDGFSILNFTVEGFDIESNKLSAVSSSIQSLAKAITKQLMKSKLSNTFVETDKGTLVFLSTNYKGKPCVLCFIAHKSLNVAKARYFSVQLAEAIAEIKD